MALVALDYSEPWALARSPRIAQAGRIHQAQAARIRRAAPHRRKTQEQGSEEKAGHGRCSGKSRPYEMGQSNWQPRMARRLTVKLTGQTEFRKDREPAKATDFKVGDMVMVRGDENADHSVTARIVGARTGGPGGPGGGGRQMGTLGKDYVVGEVKSIDAPRLTVLRPDNVTQTVELNEETSLRKGRDSITMAEIQVGDHVMARGSMEKDVFVPKGVMVMNAEQWKRMQEMREQYSGQKAPGSEATPPKP